MLLQLRNNKTPNISQADRKLIEDYQNQVRELRDKLDSMEDAMRKKEDEMNSALDQELLLWVHATLIDSAMVAFDLFVAPLSAISRGMA